MKRDPWWKECDWIKPAWWRDGPDGKPRKLKYTNHARCRADLYGFPRFARMPDVEYMFCEVSPTVVEVVAFRAHSKEGDDIVLVVKVPLFEEYGLVITCFAATERRRKTITGRRQKVANRRPSKVAV